jgi:hypothetical protein
VAALAGYDLRSSPAPVRRATTVGVGLFTTQGGGVLAGAVMLNSPQFLGNGVVLLAYLILAIALPVTIIVWTQASRRAGVRPLFPGGLLRGELE